MNQASSSFRATADVRPRVRYAPTDTAQTLLQAPGTLAVFDFDGSAAHADDPRRLRVPLRTPSAHPAPLEHWQVEATVEHGREGALQWSSGGGWLFAALTLDEREHGGPEGAARESYAQLCAFLERRPQRHVQRLWNYLAHINDGEGDAERYKQFCAGRLDGMRDFFRDGFPAATAIGHRLDAPLLQVYCLAAEQPGERIENPRQMSAWRYPRQYGPTPPSFARAMRLRGDASLAISGTASITGHESQHHGDLQAQLHETLTNLRALLRSSALPERFDDGDPLKVYVRHAEDAPTVEAFLAEHVPDAPRLLLLGDVCRRELLVEIDGWRFA
ncbi:pteridine-dependent deoxygenase [Oleiagrimonas soli]|uniref:Chorismate lyase/3-hydroxybenzoate synthase n=1 Tax=Oleiagrimonas soli TaxID=1543381 RepID=A0A099CSG8_9GAMM|nr:pteridine-dependent deoxygenase [Oleiagrimonas soli]KGI76734.1 pteridine-dependent deoxygenase [Oleiagrimonas soli]MBB6185031.1 chorismate lyase/3-hydroxybenzoate synthase [Oleiagrimonas soli]